MNIQEEIESLQRQIDQLAEEHKDRILSAINLANEALAGVDALGNQAADTQAMRVVLRAMLAAHPDPSAVRRNAAAILTDMQHGARDDGARFIYNRIQGAVAQMLPDE